MDVAGSLAGNVAASERVAIAATGRLIGDVRSPRISIAEGAAQGPHRHGRVAHGRHTSDRRRRSHRGSRPRRWRPACRRAGERRLTLSGALAQRARVSRLKRAPKPSPCTELEGDLRVRGPCASTGAVVVGSASRRVRDGGGATFRGQLDMPDVTPSPGAGSKRARATTGATKPSADASTPSASSADPAPADDVDAAPPKASAPAKRSKRTSTKKSSTKA